MQWFQDFLNRDSLMIGEIFFLVGAFYNSCFMNKGCSRKVVWKYVFDKQSLLLSKKIFVLLIAKYFTLEIACGHPRSWPPAFLPRFFYFSIPASHVSVKVTRSHPLVMGNMKQGLIANTKYKLWLTQLGNGLLLSLSLLEKRKYNYLLSYSVYSNPTEYNLSAAFFP